MSTTSAPTAATGAPEPGRFLTFRLDNEVYGVPILNVREIVEMQEISPVPRSSAWVRGVVNLRGRVLPVIDPKVRFGLDPVETTDLTVIVVLQSNDRRPFGVVVDEVLEVQRLEESNLSETPDLADDKVEFMAGFGKVRDELVFLLDPAALDVR